MNVLKPSDVPDLATKERDAIVRAVQRVRAARSALASSVQATENGQALGRCEESELYDAEDALDKLCGEPHGWLE